MTRSLRALLLGLTSAAIVAFTLGGLALHLHHQISKAHVRLAHRTEQLAAVGAPLLLDSLVVGDLARAEEILRKLNGDRTWREVRLYEPDGQRAILDASPLVTARSTAPRWFRWAFPLHLEGHRVVIEAPPVGYGVLAVTPSPEALLDELWTETWSVVGVTAVLLAVMLAFMDLILVRGLRPIRVLSERATRLGRGDLSARMPDSVPAEIVPAAQAFNAMAASLERALQEARTRQRRLEELLAVTAEMSMIHSVDTVLERVAEACGKLINTDSVTFWLADDAGLAVAGTWGPSRNELQKDRLERGESLGGIVATTGEPLSVRDPADDPRMVPVHREAMRRHGYRGYLAVPAKVGDRVVGVLSLQTRRADGYSAEDLAIATAFAARAAIALENSRLLQERQRAYEELSQTQDQLEQIQKMEAIGRLAGGVAHDFNNMLTVILGRTQMLLASLRAEDPLRRGIELIQKTANRAADLTRQLLAFSRKQVLDPVVMDLNVVTLDMKEMLGRLIGEDVTLVTSLDAGLGRVRADRGQIEQVMLNLIVNARDAMPQGGRVTIQTANETIDADYARRHVGMQPGAHVVLAVTDTGVGIPREVQAHIFEPFFTTKGLGKGTGLGLATVYGIVNQSGGHIEVLSEPDRGTTFRILLPTAAEAVGPAERSPAHAPALEGSETILLVEDEEAVRELARDILQSAGYTVLEARHGGEALSIAQTHAGPVHLLLTDVVMPHMSGREVVERLQPMRPDMRVCYMSGYTDDAVVRHGVLNAGIAFLQKPFTPAGLTRRMREVLDAGVRSDAGADPHLRLTAV